MMTDDSSVDNSSSESENEIIIDNPTIKILLSSQKDHVISNKKYYFLGKGGDGLIYRIDDKAVKIYTKIDMNNIVREFYVVGLLQELSKVNRNIIEIDRYYLSLNSPVMVMELMDGDLAKWCDETSKNKNKFTQEVIDDMWMVMMFQVTYGFMFLNRLSILHSDTKAKNILYKKIEDNDSSIIYDVNGKRYTIPGDYVYKIADFGAVQILGSKTNKLPDQEIKDKIKNREDLYELSRIVYRILVNVSVNDFTMQQIEPLTRSNKQYKEYYDEQKVKIERELRQLPKHQKDKMLLRSMIYYGIENDILPREQIVNRYSLSLPSERVENVLGNLTNVSKYPDVFELFNQFSV